LYVALVEELDQIAIAVAGDGAGVAEGCSFGGMCFTGVDL